MYFSNLNKVEEIKKVYRKLCFKHHPDRGGDTAIMQEINSQYKKALQSVDGQKQTGSDGQEHTYYYNADIEQSLMDKISQLLSYKIRVYAQIGSIPTSADKNHPIKKANY